ncbi:MAG: hypothetical protein NZ908_00260 [Candidatus Micrarchaeota archaeon]|nr:hypothetical protein [Candidatus Micrarchaeota archaeon]MCX8154655.1 hypothetical protein [Candidatus Micrarchaeota archaeon]
MENIREELDRLKDERKEIFFHLKEVEENLGYLIKEKEYLQPSVDKFNEMKLYDLKRKQKRLEYLLVTQSKNAKNEKKYLDKLISIERKLKEYAHLFEARTRYNIVIKQIETLEKQRDELKQKIQELDNKINEHLKALKSNMPKRRKREKPEIDVENQETDDESIGKNYVSLEDLISQDTK